MASGNSEVVFCVLHGVLPFSGADGFIYRMPTSRYYCYVSQDHPKWTNCEESDCSVPEAIADTIDEAIDRRIACEVSSRMEI